MIDLSICKKIICIIQKSFETYLNITSCKKYIQLTYADGYNDGFDAAIEFIEKYETGSPYVLENLIRDIKAYRKGE
jgi:hypothetical protein